MTASKHDFTYIENNQSNKITGSLYGDLSRSNISKHQGGQGIFANMGILNELGGEILSQFRYEHGSLNLSK